jgi:quinol monooxygenase YgiN
MILAIYSFHTSPERNRDLIDVLHSVIGQTQFVTGCICSKLCKSLDESDTYVLYEEWEHADDLERHFISPLFYRILSAMELCIDEPDVKFLSLTGIRRMEWIEQTLSYIDNKD